MQGPLLRHSFLHDLSRLSSGEFYMYGQFVALSILSKYGSPHQFCEGLASYILGYSECYCKMEDIADTELTEKLSEITNCEDEV